MNEQQFYGPRKARQSPLAARINNIFDKESKNRDGVHRQLRPFKSSLLGPTVVWKSFPVQLDALEYCRTAGEDVHVFAYECNMLLEGKRRFLVTSYEHFWHTYEQIPDSQRHHYEVILENVPVKLYFDLEFCKEVNQGSNGEDMVGLFLGELELIFQEIYAKPLSRHNMVQLDASTAVKFSQHIIFPSVIFQNVSQAGMFVHFLCQRITDKSSLPTEKDFMLDKLLVKSYHKDDRALFIDQGVYTKNRNFRLLNSSKLHKHNPLLVSTSCPVQEMPEREIFLLSLICNVRAEQKRDLLAFDIEKYPLSASHQKLMLHGKEGALPSQMGSSTSPFPELDKFFIAVITANGLQGKIRQWQFFPDTQTMLYAITGEYKYCARIGRHHQSNNILFVACLRKGTYHQKCMDSDCRDFRSNSYLLPFQLLPESIAPLANSNAVEDSFDAEGDCFLANLPLDAEVL